MSTSVGFIFSQKNKRNPAAVERSFSMTNLFSSLHTVGIWQGWTHGCKDGTQHLQLDLTFLHILLRGWTILILRIGWADWRMLGFHGILNWICWQEILVVFTGFISGWFQMISGSLRHFPWIFLRIDSWMNFTTIDTLVTTQCFDSWCWILSWSWLMYANANATLAKMSHQQSPPPQKNTIFTMEKDYIWPPQK